MEGHKMITFEDVFAITVFGFWFYGLLCLLDYGGELIDSGKDITWIAPIGIVGCIVLLILTHEYLRYRNKESKE